MKKLISIAFLLALFSSINIEAQKKAPIKAKQLFGDISARQIGPALMSGRINDLENHPTNNRIIYAGTAGGGVWKSNDGGTTFNPIFDEYCQSIGAVALDPNDPDNTIYVGTGETWTRNSISVGDGMYKEYGGCPSAGCVVVIGYVSGKQCIVIANDATVKAGAWFPITAKKNLRAQEISIENKLPIIYLVDSAGVYLPMQDEIFPDKEHFGRIFRNNAVMSSMGITQISAVMGSCVAGGAYLPIMSDEAIIVDKTGSIFLAGSYLVKAAIGESIDNETLGGATTHCEISGVTDYKAKDDKDALDKIKNIVSKIGDFDTAGYNREKDAKPAKDHQEI
mgnify:CR=1 FL=1